MSIELRLLLAVLSTYRLAQLIAVDNGPYDIFLGIRAFFGRRATINGSLRAIALLVSCPYCMGIWISPFCAALAISDNYVADVILIVLGIAGAQTALESFTNRTP
jgi:hypothetical protein